MTFLISGLKIFVPSSVSTMSASSASLRSTAGDRSFPCSNFSISPFSPICSSFCSMLTPPMAITFSAESSSVKYARDAPVIAITARQTTKQNAMIFFFIAFKPFLVNYLKIYAQPAMPANQAAAVVAVISPKAVFKAYSAPSSSKPAT